MMKYTLAAALVGILGASNALAQELNVASYTGNVPFEFEDATGALTGFEVDLVNLVAKQVGKTPRFTPMPFNSLFNAVQSGRAELAIGTITVTKKRLESVAFSQPYFDSNQCLITSAGSAVKGISDLSGVAVAVVTGSTGEIWASTHQQEKGIAEIRRYDSTNEAMLDIATGRITAYVYDCPSAAYYIKDKPNYAIVATIPTNEQFALMLPKGSPMLSEVNEALTTLKNNGELAKLYEKWLGMAAEPNSSTVVVQPLPKL